MRVVLEVPQAEGDRWTGGENWVIPNGVPPQVGTDVVIHDREYKAKVVTLVVDDGPEPWCQVRLETVASFVRRRDRQRTEMFR